MRTGKQHFRLIVVVFAALAAAVPAAQAAGGSPDDRALYRGTSAALAPASIGSDDRAVYRGTSAALAPASIGSDDRAVYRGTSAALAPKSLSPDDRAFARSVPGVEPRTVPVGNLVRPDGFDWNDAVIGSALALAFALGAGAILFTRHRRGAFRTA